MIILDQNQNIYQKMVIKVSNFEIAKKLKELIFFNLFISI